MRMAPDAERHNDAIADVPIAASGTLIAAAGECAQERFIESGFRSCLSAFGPPPAQAAPRQQRQ